VALVDAAAGVRRSYAELADRSARLAAYLANQHGVRRGDRVAVLANGSARTFELLVAASRLGAVLAPLNFRLADAELADVLLRAAPRVLFVDAAYAARASQAPLETTPRLRLDDDAALDVAPLSAELTAKLAAVSDPLVVLFTSGTTGKSKGALLTERGVF